ncbi:MAG: sigma-70 family RNA polymerase sigma factor [Archangiaceae bacterium]|nr:sigma-70 family RNA polymerase sigma factor [Archangiaceae bacterium]
MSPSDRERLSVMFEAHYDLVWRVLRRSGLTPAAADDGAQQVFMIAGRRLADITPGKERAFLCAAALKVAPRLRSSREEPADAAPEPIAPGTPEDAIELKRRRALLDEVLSEMEHDLRAVLVLTEIEGLTKREVAEALEIPEGTAASRLRRAREDFDARLARRKLKVAP